MEYTRMVQLWKMWKDVNQLRMRVLSEVEAVKAFHLEFKARLSWTTAVLEIFAVEFNLNHFLE